MVFTLHSAVLFNPVIVVTLAEKQVTSAQLKEHRGAVLDLIEMYLKGKFMQCFTLQTTRLLACPLLSVVNGYLISLNRATE